MGAASARPAGARPEQFRSDINGLRAISIALVMAYHLGGGLAPGGFVGVDVFFVISGFLMTQIILGGLQAGRFTLRGFYLARLRRIGPALAVLIAGLWLIGATCLDPMTFRGLAARAPAALLMVSNFSFARDGYFAPDSASNWLLHTWSLAVEWQFYLVYPLVLLALARCRPPLRWTGLAALAAASFATALALGALNAKLDFYLLPSRAWELLAGGFCFGLVGRIRLAAPARWTLHVAGLVLIAAGAVLARPGLAWPSWMTLLPVGGACAVILADLRRTGWAELRAVGALGLASYSIYLWHWPVMVWLHDADIPVTPAVAAAAVAAMLALGFASYWLVERRLTRWVFAPRPWRRALGAGLTLLVLALSGIAAATDGLEGVRTLGFSPAAKAALADDRSAASDWTYPRICAPYAADSLKLCPLGAPSARRVLVIGDSRAEQVAPRYAKGFDFGPGGGVTFTTIAGCIPIPAVSEQASPGCGRRWADIYRYAERAGFSRVVIIAAWQRYFAPDGADPLGVTRLDGQPRPASLAAEADAEFALLTAAVRRLQAQGIEVVVMGSTPRAPDADPQLLYARTFWMRTPAAAPPLSRSLSEALDPVTRPRLRALAQSTGAAFVEPLDGLCDGDVCPTMAGGRTLYKDPGHLRASMLGLPRFAYLDAWLAPGSPSRLK
jgi:peptidoglycan/LPS O-acetylase OafA/YrhL